MEKIQTHKKRRWVLAVIIILVLAGLGCWWWRVHTTKNEINTTTIPSEAQRIEELKQLQASSAPVTATTKDRTSTTTKLEKSSKPVTVSKEDRLAQLEALSH
jgi:cytoskeletal protein RodZ